MTFSPGQLMSSPLGRPIRLERLDGDGKWICRYLDTDKRQFVALSEQTLYLGFKRRMRAAH